MSHPIVVGVDAARASGDALFWAVAEARRRHTWVLLLHAADSADAEAAAAAGTTVSARAAGLIRAHRRVATRLAPDVRILGQVAGGPAADVLVEASGRAELLVIGSRGRAGQTESALGSVSQRVAAHAHCPVVVVPPGCSRLVIRRVAVAIADLDVEHPVLELAAEEARRWQASLCLVQGLAAEPEPASAADLVDAAAYLRRQYPDVVVERNASADDAVGALIAEAGRSDLLVLGCRHTDDAFGCRIGAVAAGLLPEVSCPVALVGGPR